jgi:hypothetical protein
MGGRYLSPEVPGVPGSGGSSIGGSGGGSSSGGDGGGEDIVPLSSDSVVSSTGRASAGSNPAASKSPRKIRSFTQGLGTTHEEKWNRTPNTTGTGAIHVKSFHCKLTGDSLIFIDEQINEWLDAHPQYEVKLVTTSIGLWTGKLKEPNLIVNVWV